MNLGDLKLATEIAPKELFRELRVSFGKDIADYKKRLKQRIGGSYSRYQLGSRTKLARRSGLLARSIVGSAYGRDLTTLGGFIGLKSWYAPIHETGGTLTSKRSGGWLKVPTENALTARGRIKKELNEKKNRNKFVLKKSGRNILAFWPTGRGKRKKLVLMFVLVKSVRIPARLGAMDLFRGMIPEIERNANEAVLRAMNTVMEGGELKN
jgi:hypothetical protein